MCKRWCDSFADFLSDIGPRPSPVHQLDRIDNNGNYEPGNTRWVLRKIQCRNKRDNRLLTFNGTTKTLAEWAEDAQLNYYTLRGRIRYGWSLEKAITTPRLRASHWNRSGQTSSKAA